MALEPRIVVYGVLFRPYAPQACRMTGRRLRRPTLLVLLGLFVLSFVGSLALSRSGRWGDSQLVLGPGQVFRSSGSSPPRAALPRILRQHLAAADEMLAAGDLREAQNEYLMILLSMDHDSKEAWEGLVT